MVSPPDGLEKSPASFIYRMCIPEDIGEMALVLDRANVARDGGIGNFADRRESRLKEVSTRMNVADSWAHAAFDSDRMAGFVLGYSSMAEGTKGDCHEDTEYLALLMTDPEYQGRGIGSALLDIAAAEARSRGRERMFLWTQDDNKQSRSVYERKGYRAEKGKTRYSTREELLVCYMLDL